MDADLLVKAARSLEKARSAKFRLDENLEMLDEKLRQNRSDKLLDLMASQKAEDKEKLDIYLRVQKTFDESIHQVETEADDILNQGKDKGEAIHARGDSAATTTPTAVRSDPNDYRTRNYRKPRGDFKTDVSKEKVINKADRDKARALPSVPNPSTTERAKPKPAPSYNPKPKVDRPKPTPIVTKNPARVAQRQKEPTRHRRKEPERTTSSPVHPFIAVPLSLPRIMSLPHLKYTPSPLPPSTVVEKRRLASEEVAKPVIESSTKETQISSSPPLKEKILSRHSMAVMEIVHSDSEDSESSSTTTTNTMEEKEEVVESFAKLESDRIADLIVRRERLVERVSAALEREILRVVQERLRENDENRVEEEEEERRLVFLVEEEVEEEVGESNLVDPYLLKGLIEEAISEQLRSVVRAPSKEQTDQLPTAPSTMPKTPPVTPPPQSPTSRVSNQFRPSFASSNTVKTPPRTPSPVKIAASVTYVVEEETLEHDVSRHWVHQEPIHLPLNRNIPVEPKIPTPRNSAPSSPSSPKPSSSPLRTPLRNTPVDTPSPSPRSPEFLDLPAPRSTSSVASQPSERCSKVEKVSVGVGRSVEIKSITEAGASLDDISEHPSSPISSSISSSITSYAPNATSVSEGQIVSYSIKAFDPFSLSEQISEMKEDMSVKCDDAEEASVKPLEEEASLKRTEEEASLLEDCEIAESGNNSFSEGEVKTSYFRDKFANE